MSLAAAFKDEREEAASFLYYGFLPIVPKGFAATPWAQVPAGRVEAETEEVLAARGAQAFREACSEHAGDLHVVPLSGGIDSRLILAALVEAGLRDRITAVTFGTPGTLDFEIGRQVASLARVRHESIDLREVDLSQALLEDTVRAGGSWVPVFEAFYNRLVARRFGAGAVYWSGIMANTLNGSQFSADADDSWRAAIARFAARKRFATSADLTMPGFRPDEVLPPAPLLQNGRLTSYEQLYTALVYPCWYESTIIADGYEFRTPFRERPWVDFILRAPTHGRTGQRLYHRIVSKHFPELFSIPTRSNHGVALGAPAWRTLLAQSRLRTGNLARRRLPWLPWAPRPKTNYIDFDVELRRRADLKRLVTGELEDLEARGLVDWLDLAEIWERHQRGRGNHADALTLLASLEINLKVREKGAPTVA